MSNKELVLKEIQNKKTQIKEQNELIIRAEEKIKNYEKSIEQDYEDLKNANVDPLKLDEEIKKTQELILKGEEKFKELYEELQFM